MHLAVPKIIHCNSNGGVTGGILGILGARGTRGAKGIGDLPVIFFFFFFSFVFGAWSTGLGGGQAMARGIGMEIGMGITQVEYIVLYPVHLNIRALNIRAAG